MCYRLDYHSTGIDEAEESGTLQEQEMHIYIYTEKEFQVGLFKTGPDYQPSYIVKMLCFCHRESIQIVFSIRSNT